MVSRNRTGRSARVCFGAALLSSTMLAWTPALAQDEGTRVDEVIVTAQKRSESLQDVPFSIQALGTETLENLQITNMNQFVQFLPSVSQRSAGPGATNVYMRGVASGDNANHSGPQPSVSVYLDEQPVTTIQGALDVHVYDIARVEALAGPQGTLYGASSQAGTIRIITNKPSMAGFEAGYDLELNTVDGGDSGWSMEGFANLPLSERMALRVVGWNLYDAGYIDNVPNTRLYTARGIFLGDPLQNTPVSNAPFVEENYNDSETYGARAALRIDLNDSWTATPSVMFQDQKSNGNFGYDPNIGDLMNSRYRPENAHDRWWQAAMAIEGRIANLDVMYSGSYLNRKIDAELDYSDYSYFYDAAYGVYWQDDLGVPLNDPSQYIQGRDRFTKESHEFRISSPQDRRVRFIAGLFHQRQQHQIRQRYKIDDLTPTYEVTGWSDTLWLTEQLRTDRDWAAFGDVTFDLTDRLSASAGVRFFKAENSLQGFFGFNSNYSSGTGENACFATPVQIGDAPCTNVDKVFEEEGFTHKLNLTYNFDDDRMVYATWSTGYRPGGVNRRGTLPPYESDFLTNYEIGWKTSWLGNTLRFNGAVFYAEWEDFQIGVLGQNGLTDNRNAGGAEIKGLEADLFWRATPGFTVNGGISLLDAQTTVNFCKADALGNTVFDCVGADLLAPPGTELPLTPDFKGNVTARNEFALGPFDAHLQGSLVHQSSAWSDLRLIERAILGKMPSYTTLDFSGGFGRGNWTMELFLRNATDERANIQRYAQCQIQVCGGAVYIVPIQPRTFGIRFGQKF